MLNIPRLNQRVAAAVLDALGYSRGGQLPLGLFDAFSWSEEEAGARQLDVNMQRMVDELMRDSRN